MEVLVVTILLGLLGYVLGVVGFFRAGAAMREVQILRRLVEREALRSLRGEVGSPTAVVDPLIAPAPPPAGPIEELKTGMEHVVEPPPAVAPPVKPDDPEDAQVTPTPPVTEAGAPGGSSREFDLESLITLRWAAWLGAVALLLAGVFLVRYAAEQGLLGPATRCCAAALLGLALLAGAARVQRMDLPAVEGPFDVDQAPAALAAGGVAVLFGAAYGAGPFYDLVPPLAAFVGMAACSFLGLLASLRFGPLTAAVGILGAFATPALVTTQSPSWIGLFAYLALATAGAHAVVRRTAWTWLGWAVTIGGAAWVLIAAPFPPDPQTWAVAAFVPVSAILGLLLPAAAIETTNGRFLAWGQFAIIAFAGVWLTEAIPNPVSLAAVLALSPIAVWKGSVERRLDRLPWLAAACGLVGLWLWSSSETMSAAQNGSETVGWAKEGWRLCVAIAFAAAYAGVGLRQETRRPDPARWAALVGTVPVLTLAVCYASIGQFEADIRWGLVGVALALLLVAATARAMGSGDRDRAGVHAAAAVAALSLAFATTLHDHWLTTALALTLPGVAWVEAQVRLRALRIASMVVAAAVFALLTGWLLHDLVFGLPTTFGSLIAAYAVPAAAFAVAAHVFRRGGHDALVAMLESGAIASSSLFVTLEVRQWFGSGYLNRHFGFDEVATLMLATAAEAYACHRIVRRTGRATVRIARDLLGRLAYVLALGLLADNPMLSDARAGPLSLVLAYLVPAALAARFSRQASAPVRVWLFGYAVAAGFAWATLQVRLSFHPNAISLFRSTATEAELWSWSGAWLAYGVLVMTLGVYLGDRLVRLTALAIVGLVCLKVFLVDMGQLTGLWRVASFLGLGLSLIGLGLLHRRFVLPSWRTESRV